jgi:hypothetical protein
VNNSHKSSFGAMLRKSIGDRLPRPFAKRASRLLAASRNGFTAVHGTPIHKTARSVRRRKTRTKQVTAPIRKTRFALTRCFAAVLLIDWALPSWTQIEKSSCKHEIFLSMPTSNLLHKKIPWLSPGY